MHEEAQEAGGGLPPVALTWSPSQSPQFKYDLLSVKPIEPLTAKGQEQLALLNVPQSDSRPPYGSASSRNIASHRPPLHTRAY